MITLAQLVAALPHCPARQVETFLPLLNAAMIDFEINTEQRVEMFLATIGHESNDLSVFEENLNYSSVGLCKTWPKRFPTLANAAPYNRNPERIANSVYANRGGNGDEFSGDGWRFRGAGGIQLTFKSNQAACAAYFKIALDDIGNWLRTPAGAIRSAAWFWRGHHCNELADAGDFDGVCDMVNIGRKTSAIGDAIGYANRVAALSVVQKAIV